VSVTALDTNALLAILYDDDYADTSEQAIREAHRAGRVVVTPIVYVELAADGQFGTRDDLDQFLADCSIHVSDPSPDGLFVAGDRFRRYLDRRPDGFQCPACGAEQAVTCDDCGEALSARQHLAADFLIGGHAETDADRLVSFDQSFYATYFPELTVHPELT
jgi:predicted nucleic acid-binding protein